MKLRSLNIILTCLLSCGFLYTIDAQNAPVTRASVIKNAVPGQQVIVKITVSDFINIGSISLALNYDHSRLNFVSGTINTQLSSSGNYAIGDNDAGNGTHRIIAGWYGSGTSLADSTTILTYVFTYLSGSSILQWYDNGTSSSYTDPSAKTLNDTPSSLYYKDGMVSGTDSLVLDIEEHPDFVNGGKTNNYIDFQIYPNPAKDHFILEMPEASIKPLKVSVWTTNGILIKKFDIENNTGESSYYFEINNLPAGLYFISVNCGLEKTSRKLIIL